MKVLLPDPVTPITAMMMSDGLQGVETSVYYPIVTMKLMRLLYLKSRLGTCSIYSGGLPSSALDQPPVVVTIFRLEVIAIQLG
jgi:hypothetical protein